MTILDIQDHVTENYFKKGMDYFRKGKVADLGAIENEWRASVEGRERYIVNISLEGKHVAHSSCSCRAFNHGDHCKHVVAVLIAIYDGLFQSRWKDSTVTPYTVSLLNSLSAEDLRLFLLKEMHFDAFLVDELRDFAESTRESGDLIKHVETINQSFINIANVSDEEQREAGWVAVKAANRLLQRAQKEYREGNINTALDLLFAVITKKPSFDANESDTDSSYQVIVRDAFRQLDEICTNAELDEYNRRRLTRRAWSCLYSELFAIADYEIHWLEIMMRHGDVNEKKEELLELIDEMIEECKERNNAKDPALARLISAKHVIQEGNTKAFKKSLAAPLVPASGEAPLRLPVPAKAVTAKTEKKPAALSEKKAAYLRDKDLLLEQLKKEKDRDTRESLQKTLIMLMQQNSDVFGIREMAPGFYEETGHIYFYEAVKDTYMVSEWNELMEKQKRPQAIIRRMNR